MLFFIDLFIVLFLFLLVAMLVLFRLRHFKRRLELKNQLPAHHWTHLNISALSLLKSPTQVFIGCSIFGPYFFFYLNISVLLLLQSPADRIILYVEQCLSFLDDDFGDFVGEEEVSAPALGISGFELIN